VGRRDALRINDRCEPGQSRAVPIRAIDPSITDERKAARGRIHGQPS
jgi:hypothetical protein